MNIPIMMDYFSPISASKAFCRGLTASMPDKRLSQCHSTGGGRHSWWMWNAVVEGKHWCDG